METTERKVFEKLADEIVDFRSVTPLSGEGEALMSTIDTGLQMIADHIYREIRLLNKEAVWK